MKLSTSIFLITFLLISTSLSAQTSSVPPFWEKISLNGLHSSKLSLLTADSFSPQNLIVSSGARAFESRNRGKDWKQIFQGDIETEQIIAIKYNPGINTDIYILTNTTLYFCNTSAGSYRKWTKVYRTETTERQLSGFDINPFDYNELMLSSDYGLLISSDKGISWHKSSHSHIRNKRIQTASFHPNHKNTILILTDTSIIAINRNINKHHIYRLPPISNETDTTEEETKIMRNPAFTFFSHNDDLIALLRRNTLCLTSDRGKSWSSKILTKIRPLETNKAQNPAGTDHLVINSGNQIFSYDINTEKIKQLSSISKAKEIYDFTYFDHIKDEIFSVTENGMFSLCLNSPKTPTSIEQPHKIGAIDISPDPHKDFSEVNIPDGPSIRDLQQKAIDYANVSAKKMKDWHKRSRYRAALPSLSLDYEFDAQENIDIDRGSTSTEDIYIMGPEEKASGWNLSIEWDLADLVWNKDQTSIDYREKYMIETREQILNQLTALYFERKKIQMTLRLSPPQSELEILTLALRAEELTANIDALTGGYFSEKIAAANRKNPSSTDSKIT